MAITDWPSAERPREKLLAKGAEALSDAELLAIFLRTGVRGKTAVDLARECLLNFGSLRQLLEATKTDFCQHLGLGVAKYVLVQASLEIAKRNLFATLQRGETLNNPSDTKHYLTAQLRRYTHEVFAGLFLDTQHRIVSFEEIIHGTLNKAEIHPREVIKLALRHNAAAVIFAHNHPSGIAKPSEADKLVTRQLQQVLELLDIRVLDHLVIGDGEVASFAELGLL